MNDPSVVIDHLIYDYTFNKLKIVAAVVETTQSRHRVGYLKREGWFCNCSKARRCKQIEHVKKHVPSEGISK